LPAAARSISTSLGCVWTHRVRGPVLKGRVRPLRLPAGEDVTHAPLWGTDVPTPSRYSYARPTSCSANREHTGVPDPRKWKVKTKRAPACPQLLMLRALDHRVIGRPARRSRTPPSREMLVTFGPGENAVVFPRPGHRQGGPSPEERQPSSSGRTRSNKDIELLCTAGGRTHPARLDMILCTGGRQLRRAARRARGEYIRVGGERRVSLALFLSVSSSSGCAA
jgi:hypothetical protein